MENREIRPFHQNIERLIEIKGDEVKELSKAVSKLPIGFYALQINHISYNIHVKNRNFSFNAAERLLKSMEKKFYKDETGNGYIAFGYPLVAPRRNLRYQQQMEDKFVRDELLAVVFEIVYNELTNRREIMIITGWSENDIN